MKLRLVRVPNGYAFADAESAKAAEKHRLGETVSASIVKPRSGPFHRKFLALLRFTFDYWEPADAAEPVTYRGHVVEKDFERFRGDVVVLCGHYTPVWNANGEMRLEPASIAFDQMEPDDFARLYSTAVGVCMRIAMSSKGFTEDQLRRAVDEISRFDG